MTSSILILGAGNMGGALARCWHKAGVEVQVVARNPERAAALGALGIPTTDSLKNAPNGTLVLAIKPQQFAAMVDELKPHTASRCVISVMAGVTLEALSALSPNVVRVMPNLPAAIGESMSIACAPAADAATRQTITRLFTACGRVAWIEDEAMMHAAIGIAGSGSGYVFTFMAALHAAAVARGFTPETARQLVAQTFRGAALMAEGAPESFAVLAANVASPNGTTQAAYDALAAGDFESLIARAVDAAINRSKALA